MTTTTLQTGVVRHNLYNLHVIAGGALVDEQSMPFDVDAYSRFKYGQADVGRRYGYALATDFIGNFPEVCLDPDKIVVSGPSYKYLSTASHGVVHHFCVALNAYRVKRGLEPVQEMHSIRSTVGSDTYAMAMRRFVQRICEEQVSRGHRASARQLVHLHRRRQRDGRD